MKYLLLSFLVFLSFDISGQYKESKSWCNLNCEYTAQDKTTADLIRLRLENDSIRSLVSGNHLTKFPIRIALVQKDTIMISQTEINLRQAIDNLNEAFEPLNFSFYLDRVDIIKSDLYLEDLSQNQYSIYDVFSKQHDLSDIISIYVLDHRSDFCKINGNAISCARTGGFSYILSDRTSNIVMSKFDLLDKKVLPHEFGHFFGLFHTFEEHLFGKDNFDANNCQNVGDRICDTPPDPGTLFEIYNNYSTCEMVGFHDANGNEYKPILENFMSYYKPCYLKKYSFTQEQMVVMQLSALLDIRSKFSRT